MNTKIISFETLKVSLTEINPQAKKTVIFIHGNSGSTNSWRYQLNNPLFSEYNLISLDLPGCGNSIVKAKHYENYSLPGMAKTMANTIQELKLNNHYILVGFSLGTNVITEMLAYLKPAGVVLVSSSILGKNYTLAEAFQDGLDFNVFFTDNAPGEDVAKAMQKASFSGHTQIQDVLLNDYKSTQSGFRPTLLQTYNDGLIGDEIELLKTARIPALIVFGRDEEMANPDYLDKVPFKTWKNKVFKIPNAGHYVQMDAPGEFNRILLEYFEDRF